MEKKRFTDMLSQQQPLADILQMALRCRSKSRQSPTRY